MPRVAGLDRAAILRGPAYLMPPVTPSTIWRWKKANTRSIGSAARTVEAIICAYWMPYELWTDARPTGIVIMLLAVMTINGQRKLFQEAMNARIATAATAGMDMGMQIRQYTRSRLAPSRIAASSYSRGMPSKYCLKMKTAIGEASCGKMIPPYVLTSWKELTS